MIEYEPHKTYIDKCTHIGEAKLFNFIITHMNKETRMWYSNRPNKERVKEDLGLSIASIDRYILSLTKSNLLIRHIKGAYEVNSDFISFDTDEKKLKK